MSILTLYPIMCRHEPFESVAGMGENKKYKKIKVKKHKLKGNKAKSELLFAAEKADLVVDEYTDQVMLQMICFHIWFVFINI